MIDIGTTLADGSVYAGHHPDHDGFLVCELPCDRKPMTWKDACLMEGKLRLPTLYELALLYAYRDKLYLGCDRWYWSGTLFIRNCPFIRHFTHGGQKFDDATTLHHVRLVRLVTQEELEALI